MIVAEPKALEEIVPLIEGLNTVYVLGCGTCVTVCLTGGDREAHILAQELSNPALYDGRPPTFEVETIERQCERDMLKAYQEIPAHCDAVLSLACGAGVNTG